MAASIGSEVALPRPPSKKWVTFDDLQQHQQSRQEAKTENVAMKTTAAALRRSSCSSSGLSSSVSSQVREAE